MSGRSVIVFGFLAAVACAGHAFTPIPSLPGEEPGLSACRHVGAEPPSPVSRRAPRLVPQSGHSEEITVMAFSPRGALLATGSQDGAVKLWLAKTGQLLATFTTSSYWVHTVAFSGDGCLVAAGSGDHKIYVWSLESQELVETLEPHAGAARALAFSADGRMLAASTTGLGSHPVKPQTMVWDVDGWRKRADLDCDGCAAGVHEMVFLPGAPVLVLMAPQKLLVWDYESNRIVQQLPTASERTGRLFLSRDGTHLAAAGIELVQRKLDRSAFSNSYFSSVVLWDISAGRIDPRPLLKLSDMWGAGFGPEGDSLVALEADHLSFYDQSSSPRPDPNFSMALKTCSMKMQGCGPALGTLPAIQMALLSPDGGHLAFTTASGLEFIELGAAAPRHAASSQANGVSALFYSGGVLAAGLRRGQISVWDKSLRVPVRTFQQPIVDVARGMAAFSLAGDGTLLSAAADGGAVRWDLAGPRSPVEVRVATEKSRGDSSIFAREEIGLVRPEPPRAFQVISVDGVPQKNDETEEVLVTALSPGGTIATGGLYFGYSAGTSGFVRLWNESGVSLGERFTDEHRGNNDVTALSFSPNGGTLAIGFSDGSIDLLSVRERKVISRLDEHKVRVTALAFSADGKYLASGSLDRTAKIWTLGSSAPPKTLSGHTGTILCLGFSPEQGADMLASGGSDNRIILWRASSGERIQALEGHSAPVNALVFAPRGGALVSGGEDATVRFWDTRSFQPLATLVAVSGGKQWLATTPDGFFDGDEETWNQVLWQFNGNLFDVSPAEIGFRDYFVPNLLLKMVDNQPPAPARSLSLLNRAQPEVQIVGVTPDGTDTVQVDVEAESRPSDTQRDDAGRPLLSGLYDLRLFRDGQFVGSWPQPESTDASETNDLETWRRARILLTDETGKTKVSFRRIRLSHSNDGKKAIFTAYAFNNDRVKSATSAPMEYRISNSGSKPVRRAYLITMGVNANQSGLNLDVAVPSAQRALSLLHAKLLETYPAVIDVPLYSDLGENGAVVMKKARKGALKAVLEILSGVAVDPAIRDEVDSGHQLQTATPDDAVVLYIASHGYADPQGNMFVIPFDTGTNLGITEETLTRCALHPAPTGVCAQAQAFLQHAISSADLSAWWRGVDGGKLVMVLDTCHSGALPGKVFRPGPLGDPGFGQLSYDKKMVLLSASQPAQTELGVFLPGGEARTLLVEALDLVARNNPAQSLNDWLKGVEQQLPVTMSKLAAHVNSDDLQVPVLLDFSRSEDQATITVPPRSAPAQQPRQDLQIVVH